MIFTHFYSSFSILLFVYSSFSILLKSNFHLYSLIWWVFLRFWSRQGFHIDDTSRSFVWPPFTARGGRRGVCRGRFRYLWLSHYGVRIYTLLVHHDRSYRFGTMRLLWVLWCAFALQPILLPSLNSCWVGSGTIPVIFQRTEMEFLLCVVCILWRVHLVTFSVLLLFRLLLLLFLLWKIERLLLRQCQFLLLNTIISGGK